MNGGAHEPEQEPVLPETPALAEERNVPASHLAGRVLERADEVSRALETLLASGGGAAPGAAATQESLELLHDYRVALRRLRSILRIIEPAYGKTRIRKLADAIGQAAGLTSELRDEEVLRETLSELEGPAFVAEPLGHWMRGRARRERGLRTRVLRTIRSESGSPPGDLEPAQSEPGVAGTLAKLRARLALPPKVALSDDELARTALADTFDRVRARAAGVTGDDAAAMHRLRIAFKKLRYTAEIVEGIVAPGGWENRTIALSAKLQKHLGKLHDLDEATIRMERARGLELAARREVLAGLARERKKTAAKCGREVTAAIGELGDLVPARDPSHDGD